MLPVTALSNDNTQWTRTLECWKAPRTQKFSDTQCGLGYSGATEEDTGIVNCDNPQVAALVIVAFIVVYHRT